MVYHSNRLFEPSQMFLRAERRFIQLLDCSRCVFCLESLLLWMTLNLQSSHHALSPAFSKYFVRLSTNIFAL
jgi:hypothetical protein